MSDHATIVAEIQQRLNMLTSLLPDAPQHRLDPTPAGPSSQRSPSLTGSPKRSRQTHATSRTHTTIHYVNDSDLSDDEPEPTSTPLLVPAPRLTHSRGLLANFYTAERQKPCRLCSNAMTFFGTDVDDIPEIPDCRCHSLPPADFLGPHNRPFFFANNFRSYYSWPPGQTSDPQTHPYRFSRAQERTLSAPTAQRTTNPLRYPVTPTIQDTTPMTQRDWDVLVFNPLNTCYNPPHFNYPLAFRLMPFLTLALQFPHIAPPPAVFTTLKNLHLANNDDDLYHFTHYSLPRTLAYYHEFTPPYNSHDYTQHLQRIDEAKNTRSYRSQPRHSHQ
jgi:hypothetical protein